MPASNLQGEVIDSKARLTWVASTSTGVLGYQVYQTIGGTTNTFTTASATLDVAQGWSTDAVYQVKPFVIGGVLATQYAGILTGQPTQLVGGVAWLTVHVGAELRYTMVITNTTNKDLTSLRLYYLGAAGSDPQQEITPAATSVAKGATHSWSNLAAGKYRWDWVTSNSKNGLADRLVHRQHAHHHREHAVRRARRDRQSGITLVELLGGDDRDGHPHHHDHRQLGDSLQGLLLHHAERQAAGRCQSGHVSDGAGDPRRSGRARRHQRGLHARLSL